MNIVSNSRREAMLELRENLIAVEKDRLAGKKGRTADELDAILKKVIAEVANGCNN